MYLARIITQLQKNRDGYAWYMGSFIIVAMLVLTMLFVTKWRIELAVDTVEDITTASALGAMEINAKQYSLVQDTVFSSDPGPGKTHNASEAGRVFSPDKCFEKMQDLIGDNLGVERTAGTNSYSGKSTLLDTETNPFKIKKAVFYNWYSSDVPAFVESYTYTESENVDGYSCSYKANESGFPPEAIVDNSSIYIEVEIPLYVLGRHTSITKGQWIAANFN